MFSWKCLLWNQNHCPCISRMRIVLESQQIIEVYFFLCWLVTLSFKTNLVWIQKKHLMYPFRWLLPLLLVWGIVLIQYCKHPLTDYHLYSKGLKKTVIFPHFILSLTQCLFYTQWLSVMLNNSHWFYLKNVHFLFHRAILPLVASTKLNQKNRKMTWI